MKREFDIDLLRFIGIVGILLSHASSPSLIMNLRSFDVPLMVFLSAICMTKFSQPASYTKYLKSRIIRLWLPSVIFVLVIISFLLIRFHLQKKMLLPSY